MKKTWIGFFIFCASLVPFQIHGSTAQEYMALPGLIDIRTDVSDGAYSLDQLIGMARERGFKILFISDHERVALEYGIRPLRNIIKKRVTRPSIFETGVDIYLDKITSASLKHPEMILVAGCESSPFYYWEGSPLKGNLTVHDYEKHLLVFGLEKPEDYEQLPVAQNNFTSKTILSSLSPWFFIALMVLCFSVVLLFKKGFHRYPAIVLAVVSLLVLLNAAAFRSPRFNPYGGDQGITPYQVLIDYVNSRDGMAFWNHPETHSGQGEIGPIQRDTPPYPEVLVESTGYTGFAALYGDRISATDPGGLWDQVLLEYCRGQRDQPVWGISTADFHEEGHAGEKLGNFPTVFWVREATKNAVLEAMKNGRMYAYRGDVDLNRLELNTFSIRDPQSLKTAVSGEEITVEASPEIEIRLSSSDNKETIPVELHLFRNGIQIKEFAGNTPFHTKYKDESIEKGTKSYYRLEVSGSRNRILISNPIFVMSQPDIRGGSQSGSDFLR